MKKWNKTLSGVSYFDLTTHPLTLCNLVDQ
jgi:hypothetical protein